MHVPGGRVGRGGFEGRVGATGPSSGPGMMIGPAGDGAGIFRMTGGASVPSRPAPDGALFANGFAVAPTGTRCRDAAPEGVAAPRKSMRGDAMVAVASAGIADDAPMPLAPADATTSIENSVGSAFIILARLWRIASVV